MAGPSVVGGGVDWWFLVRIPPGHTAAMAAFYLGMVLLSVAWLAVGRVISRSGGVPLVWIWTIGIVWCLPLLGGAPLFSHDVYSYLAQGTILHLGLNPYHHTPQVLAHLGGAHVGGAHVLAAVSPFWRHTTAPYGPLFLGLVSVIVAMTGSNLIVGVLLLRALELMGVVLVAVSVPHLARSLGADPRRALWLAAMSPLVLLELVAAGHNDALMAGLTVAGVTLATHRRPALGIALCALAATIKVPAALAVVFIAVTWARSAPTRREAFLVLLQSALIAVVVLFVVSVLTGVGADWISTAVFSTPERVRLAITPATAIGWTAARLARDAGIAVDGRTLESSLATVAFALTAAGGVILLLRTHSQKIVRNLGLLLLAAAVSGPAAWPWYLSWGLVLVAASPRTQRSGTLVLAVITSAFVVKPDGILALPLSSAPVVLAVYVTVAAGAWLAWQRRVGERPVPGRHGELTSGPSALAES